MNLSQNLLRSDGANWRITLYLLIYVALQQGVAAQPRPFTLYDTLRGANHALRSCYDVIHYHLQIEVQPVSRFIKGSNTILFKTTTSTRELQIDLYENMELDSILYLGKPLGFLRIRDIVKVKFNKPLEAHTLQHITVYYHGQPITAINPPWEGGFVWQKDKNLNPWVGVACQNMGAALWWPCKDYVGDKADSVTLQYTVPRPLIAVGNGRLISQKVINDSTWCFTWKVSKPILPYNVTFNLGDYSRFSLNYQQPPSSGFDMHFYVLNYNLPKAQKHFTQAHDMWATFEKLFGPYPFASDGYKVVETPYLGMEHQSCIAYGDNFKNNAFGFDFILLHESAHEYWGNSVSMTDQADMWIHESFCTYAEALYVEHTQGKDASQRYLLTQKKRIENKTPIQGPRDVFYNGWADADMYFKGTWMLHTIRHAYHIPDDKWLNAFKQIQQLYAYRHINRNDITTLFKTVTGRDISAALHAYLDYKEIPTFEYRIASGKLYYRWTNNYNELSMPLHVIINGQTLSLPSVTGQWQELSLTDFGLSNAGNLTLTVPENLFLVKIKNVSR